MESNIIEARQRDERGKGAARRLRREGRIPAIAYANGDVPVHFDVNPKLLLQTLRKKGRNTLITLQVEGREEGLPVMIKKLDRHPVTSNPLHADFLLVDVNQPITRAIKINFVGKPLGLQFGGLAQVARRTMEVSMLPADIPVQIDVDVTKLDIGDSLHIGDVVLPSGCSIEEDTKQYALLNIAAPQAEAKPEEEEEEEAEA